MQFSKSQQAVRKGVERVFGLLFRGFKILFIACELSTSLRMKGIATACAGFYIMIVEERREPYTRDGTVGRIVYF